ncbi:MAG: EamA family transporter, partial [Muribaculaceae bacterium]|nr:EamA family transporter [Muribaculaceae bacterium]
LVVVGATFVTYILVVIGQRGLRPTVAGMYNYIQPLVACIVAIIWGMDTFGMTKAFAILLIFAGVFLVTMSKSKKDMEQEAGAVSEVAGLNSRRQSRL